MSASGQLRVPVEQGVHGGPASFRIYIAVPPLVLWAIWMATRARPVAAHERTF